MTKKRSLSGIKPTGQPHWGNYFGMIRPAVDLAVDHQAYYFIADYHALTTVRDAAVLRRDTYEIAAALLACGLDPEQVVIWRQSDVPEVTELTWLLSCVTGFGLVERAHAFKAARDKGVEPNMGLIAYPVLMAADILTFDGDVVPVGKDQVQHLEMARDMAGYINRQFFKTETVQPEGRGLHLPAAYIRDKTAVVPGLDGQKMSKSYDNHIPMFLSGKKLKKRVMAIKTDSTPLEDPKDPDTCNVYKLFCLFTDVEQQAELAAKYRAGGFGYGHAKLELLAVAKAHFEPMNEVFTRWMNDTDALEEVLRDGGQRARTVAQGVVGRVRAAAGLPRAPVSLS
jgi:tryptophanyl-tRNA synthetase